MVTVNTEMVPPAGETRHDRTEASGLRAGAAAFIAYLVLSIFLWWNVWTTHPTATTVCGCGDTSKFTWFFGWTAHALGHGFNPFFSNFLYHPHGVNLLADTSSTGVGILLAPITWAVGPVASVNVALTLSPALSATAMFILLRRWSDWGPAAFVGGLLYGFSPFMIVSLSSGWVDFAFLAVPPICVLLVDDLLVRHTWRPVPTGVVLGLLLAFQFFVGTEVLLMATGFIVVGVAAVAVFAAIRRPRELQSATRPATIGFGTALASMTVLLAYPAWFALHGPASISGRVWNGYFDGDSTILRDFVLAAPSHLSPTNPVGYQGPYLSPQYIGTPCLIVVLVGITVFRRDLRLWLFGGVAVVSALVSYLHPLSALPLVQNIIPYRYVLVTYFALAVLVCLIVQHTHDAVRSPAATTWGPPMGRRVAAVSAVAVALVAIPPMTLYVGQTLPFTTQPVVLPEWFRTVAPQLPPDEVLLVLPIQYINGESPLTWQSVGGFHYKMAEEGGPGGVYTTSGPFTEGAAAIGEVSTGIPYFVHLTQAQVVATRLTLRAWGVTTVVIPDQPKLPAYDRVASVPLAAALITAATGRLPQYEHGAWVWTPVQRPSGLPPISTPHMASCVAGSGSEVPGTVQRVAQCVLAPTGTAG